MNRSLTRSRRPVRSTLFLATLAAAASALTVASGANAQSAGAPSPSGPPAAGNGGQCGTPGEPACATTVNQESAPGDAVGYSAYGIFYQYSQVAAGTTWCYEPPQYVGLNTGDAVLSLAAGRTTSSPAALLLGSVGLSYTHVFLAADSSGSVFNESQVDFVDYPPRSTSEVFAGGIFNIDDAGHNACSRVIYPPDLQGLQPGTTGQPTLDQSDVIAGSGVVRGVGSPSGCSAPPDTYHLNSFLHDDVQGGSCEKYLQDFCGAQIDQNFDRSVIAGPVLNGGLLNLYNYALGAILEELTSAYGNDGAPAYMGNYYESQDISTLNGILAQTSAAALSQGLQSYGNTGVAPHCTDENGNTATWGVEAARAANQVVNEIRWKWYDLVMPGSGYPGTDTGYLPLEYMPQASVGGYVEDLGGGNTNNQWTGPNYGWVAEGDPDYSEPYDYCMDVNSNGNTEVGVNCPSWQGRVPSEADANKPFVVNAPDNIAWHLWNSTGGPNGGQGPSVAGVTEAFYYPGNDSVGSPCTGGLSAAQVASADAFVGALNSEITSLALEQIEAQEQAAAYAAANDPATASYCDNVPYSTYQGSCSDGILDGNESDLDCGGSCSPCPDGDQCNTGSDCANGDCWNIVQPGSYLFCGNQGDPTSSPTYPQCIAGAAWCTNCN